MEYRVGSVGRVVMARFDHGDDLLAGLLELARKEGITNGWFQILGGLRQAGIVTGPEAPTVPPVPVWAEVDGAREVVGAGSIFWDGEEPRIHLHAAMGEHGSTTVGCVRRNTRIYLILEVIIFELQGIDGSRPWFAEGQFNKLSFGQGQV